MSSMTNPFAMVGLAAWLSALHVRSEASTFRLDKTDLFVNRL